MTERITELQRPDPDQLLAQLQQEERQQTRGKLKVFFGAAPGVGKTFAMLEEGRARAAEGADVVVGYAEPHARTDTEALLLGMELLPYKFVEYKGIKLKEFDLDAALSRKPAILLIDELAHTNAPGMRHAKRYQDVLEVLEAGIDVYTTLNVQHLESVNDIVERITGIKVRETLPDSVLEEADEVELVDISPEELLERLGEGKVYMPDQAERATRNFFSKGNLLALRELALRRTAERVDAQMLTFRRDHAVQTTWAASERILVCVSPSPLSARLVRAAKRLSAGLKAPWMAAYIETPDTSLSVNDRRRVDNHLRLAEQLGAQAVTLRGPNVADELIKHASANNITKIVIGKPQRPRWKEILFGSVVDELIRRSGDTDIYVIRGEAEESEPPSAPQPHHREWDWRGYVASTAIVAACTLIAFPFDRKLHLNNINILMFYLLGITWIATRYTRGPVTLASFLAVAAFDFFFVEPLYSFTVQDEQYIPVFAAMLITALTICTLTLRVRSQASEASQRERRTHTLLSLSRDLAAARTSDSILLAAVRHASQVLDCRAVILLADADGHLFIKADSNGPEELDSKDQGVAQWAHDHGQIAGAGTSTLPAAAGTYAPMKTSRGAVGVMGLIRQQESAEWDPEQRQLIEAFASQTAVAVERATLAEEARVAWERVEAEFLRNTLLSGVSHELRTPLAAIMGAAGTLIKSREGLPAETQTELLETIYSETERMERLITNLLDMTRLESGGLALNKEWQPLQEVVGSTLHHLDRRLKGRDVKIDIPPDLPLVHIDAVALEQVLANLLDNAIEYTPARSPIEISAHQNQNGTVIEVSDHGLGLPSGTEQRVFQKFFRAAPTDTRRGIGLGLTISKGIIDAHGGTIAAENRPEGGARFLITLPTDGVPPRVNVSA